MVYTFIFQSNVNLPNIKLVIVINISLGDYPFDYELLFQVIASCASCNFLLTHAITIHIAVIAIYQLNCDNRRLY